MDKFLHRSILCVAALSLFACQNQRERDCDPDVRIDNVVRVVMHGDNYYSVVHRTNPPLKPLLVTRSFGYGTDVELRDDVDPGQAMWFERKLTHKDDWSCRYRVTIHLRDPQDIH